MMNTFLWIIQGIMAAAFMMTGAMKLITKKEAVADTMGYVNDFTQEQLYGIGVLELMGAAGLILPLLTGILPVLTPVAALGLVVIMVGAFFTHLRRDEIIPMGLMNIMLIAMGLFVAYGRFFLLPG
ncbi:MAG: DoxX family protein [Anaerolineales bacterium]|nr:DoxX family protein [Anaerolineales bacterium]